MMEIDSPSPTPATPATPAATSTTATATTGTTQIKIHPLAIIGISDHQTRITTGGSPLSASSNSSTNPMIGLLFGYQNGLTISIIDAEEMEYTYPENSGGGVGGNGGASASTISAQQQENMNKKIELHQKVFPAHEIVGWYRIDTSQSNSNSSSQCHKYNNLEEEEVLPTEADLMINNGWMKEYNESPLFVLMDANEKKHLDNDRKNTTTNASNAGAEEEKNAKKTKNEIKGEEARDKLDRDEQLPLAIYETMVSGSGNGNGNGTVFVNIEFELETFEPERIAVEKVFNTKPKNLGGTVSVTTNTTSTSSADSKPSANPEDGTNTSNKKNITRSSLTSTSASTEVQTQSSTAGAQIQSLITSIEAMNTRIAVLLDFLHKTQKGDIPPDHGLLRQVRSLVNQLPLVMGKGLFGSGDGDGIGNEEEKEEKMKKDVLAMEFENEYDDMLVLSFLATISKTTKAVLSYSEKFKIVNQK
jgi:hypothetical protein